MSGPVTNPPSARKRVCGLALLATPLALACTQTPSASPTPKSEGEVQAASSDAGERALDPAALLEARGAEVLVAALEAAGLEARAEGARVSVGEHALVVAVEIEDRAEFEGQQIIAAGFALELDGQAAPALTSGVVGIGRDGEEALEVAVLEWAGQYGAPIAFAFAHREFPDRAKSPVGGEGVAAYYIPLQIDGREVFSSPVGLRGGDELGHTLSGDAFTLGLATAIAPHIPTSPGYHALIVQVVVGASGVEDADCRVDGGASEPLTRAVSALEWPRAAGSYMYKQFFVLAVPG